MSEAEGFTYSIVRSSRRRTMGITIDADGNVEVRIPLRVPCAEAERFVQERYDWIVRSRRKMLERKARHDAKDWDRLKAETEPWMRGRGGELFMAKIAGWAARMGVEYNRVTIRDTSTRWGSCSAKRNLSFTWKVFIMPEHLVDYLIVHELAHLRYMNHSQEFWSLVEMYVPGSRRIKKQFEEYV